MKYPRVKLIENDNPCDLSSLEDKINKALDELSDSISYELELIDIKLDTAHTCPEFAMIMYTLKPIPMTEGERKRREAEAKRGKDDNAEFNLNEYSTRFSSGSGNSTYSSPVSQNNSTFGRW